MRPFVEKGADEFSWYKVRHRRGVLFMQSAFFGLASSNAVAIALDIAVEESMGFRRA